MTDRSENKLRMRMFDPKYALKMDPMNGRCAAECGRRRDEEIAPGAVVRWRVVRINAPAMTALCEVADARRAMQDF
jgi:hypothetical protein